MVSSHSHTIERLEAISQHRFIRVGVTSIVLGVCSLPRVYDSPREYHRSLASSALWHRLCERDPTTSPAEQCNRLWCQYESLRQDQARLQAEKEDIARITVALGRMPNLKDVVMTEGPWTRRLRGHAELSNQDDHLRMLMPNIAPFDHAQTLHAFHLLHLALSRHPCRLTSFQNDYSTRLPLEGFLAPINTFASLRHMKLYLNQDTMVGHRGQVAAFLSSLPQLESLELQVDRAYIQESDFANMIGSTKWARLSAITLDMPITYKPFVDFCHKHQDSLRVLSIDSELFDGSWSDLVEEMRKCLYLESVQFLTLVEYGEREYVWGPTEHLSLGEEYILSGGDNPFKIGLLGRTPLDQP